MLGYIDFRKAILVGGIPEFTCLAGTMVQETYETNPAIRDACARAIVAHAKTTETDVAAAMEQRGMSPDWSASSLALHMQAVLQGAFILAKANGRRAGRRRVRRSPAPLRGTAVQTRLASGGRRMSKTATTTKAKPATKAKTVAKPKANGIDRNAPGLAPHLTCRGAAKAIDFYKKAFGAVELMRLPGPDGRLMHGAVLINGAMVMLNDEMPEHGALSPLALKGTPVTLHLNVARRRCCLRPRREGRRHRADARRRHVLGRPLRHRHRSVRARLVDRHAQEGHDGR